MFKYFLGNFYLSSRGKTEWTIFRGRGDLEHMVVSAKQLRKNNLLSVGMLEFVQQLATLPFSAGEAVRELSGNLSPLASPGLFTPQRHRCTHLYLTFSFCKVKGLDRFPRLPHPRFLSTLKFHNSMKFKIWFVAVRYSRDLEGVRARPTWRISAGSRSRVCTLHGTRESSDRCSHD